MLPNRQYSRTVGARLRRLEAMQAQRLHPQLEADRLLLAEYLGILSTLTLLLPHITAGESTPFSAPADSMTGQILGLRVEPPFWQQEPDKYRRPVGLMDLAIKSP